MTKENREAAYKHYRDLENNYTALEHLNKGILSTSTIREKAKKDADELLANSRLTTNSKEEIKEDKPVKEDKPKKTSKGE